MKYSWRITKYNPKFRDERGRFTKEDWISIDDVGELYHGVEFTIQDYLKTEDLYVNTVIEFMKSLKISTLEVYALEKYHEKINILRFDEYYPKNFINLYNKISNINKLEINEIKILCRLILRENLWARLRYPNLMKVRFGFDYYMYIESSRKCEEAIENITKSGLFVESYQFE